MVIYKCIILFKNAQERTYYINRHQRTSMTKKLDNELNYKTMFISEINTVLNMENVLCIEFERILNEK